MNPKDNSQVLAEYEKRLQFESLLAELLAHFVNLPAEEVDGAINESLRKIAQTLVLDRATLGEVSRDGQDGFATHCYAKTGVPPNMVTSAMADVPLVMKTILAGEILVVRDVDCLEDPADRENFLRYGTRAELVFPLMIGGVLRGGLAFSCAMPYDWPDEVVAGLRIVADVFTHVLARKRADQALRESEQHMRLAAEAADIGLWIWDIPRDRFWATDQARAMYGILPGELLDYQRFLRCLADEDQVRVDGAIRGVLHDGGQFRDEYRVMLPIGKTKWISVIAQCELDGSGVPARMMGASLDISDRKQAEAEIGRAMEEIRALKDRLQEENVYLRREVEGHQGVGRIVSRSPAMRQVLRQVGQVAPTSAAVLVTGETGTGKELLAAAIHEHSPRRGRAMIRVNCAAIPAALVESELFGREKGAYTGALARQIGRFELADGSTLFLDEIGELPLEAQAKLLRVLQEKEIERLGNPKPVKVDVRVIAATNRDLQKEIALGRFREDLYYRLNVFPIHLPPLRERREDIVPLVEAFAEEFAHTMGKPIEAIAKASLKALVGHHWPGNIRELRNAVERAVILAQGPTLRIELPSTVAASLPSIRHGLKAMVEVERSHILQVLEATGWRVRGPAGAAEILGLKPSTLESRMFKLGIRRPTST